MKYPYDLLVMSSRKYKIKSPFSMTTDMVGTLNYMSPEQLQETEEGSKAVKVGKWADSWSLGCILYLMAYGKLPFQEFKNNMMKISKIVDPSFPIDFPKHSCLGLGLFS